MVGTKNSILLRFAGVEADLETYLVKLFEGANRLARNAKCITVYGSDSKLVLHIRRDINNVSKNVINSTSLLN